MSLNKIIGIAEHPRRADQSAVIGINLSREVRQEASRAVGARVDAPTPTNWKGACQKGKKRGQSFSKDYLEEKRETSLCPMIFLDNEMSQHSRIRFRLCQRGC